MITKCLTCYSGMSPRKEFLRALLAGDEEKAIQIYVMVSNGKSLEENMHPSLPCVDNNHQTPMHLVIIEMNGRCDLFFIMLWLCCVMLYSYHDDYICMIVKIRSM